MKIEGGAADDVEHLRRRRLLLQRFGEFLCTLLLRLEQPHVLDGDHRLIGECHDQFDFTLVERFDSTAREPDDADRLTLAHQRHADHRAGAANLGVALFLVKRILPGIVDTSNLPGHHGAADHGPRAREDHRVSLDFQVFGSWRYARRQNGKRRPPAGKSPSASARHSRSAVSTTLCRIGCSSNLDRLMTPRTSEVAVCRSSDSRSSASSRAFSMAITA